MADIFSLFTHLETWITLVTLIFLEIVLGIDNIVFICLTSNRLPVELQHKGRRLGLALALFMRIFLLSMLSWVVHLTHPLFSIFGVHITGKGLILLLGGIYLIYKGVVEIKQMIELKEEREAYKTGALKETLDRIGLWQALATIAVMDIVFSLDSVITAVGLSGTLVVMALAIIISVIFMMIFADTVARIIESYPIIKLLALIFIFTVGCMLVLECFEVEFNQYIIYFTMGFSLVFAVLYMKYQKNLNDFEQSIEKNIKQENTSHLDTKLNEEHVC